MFHITDKAHKSLLGQVVCILAASCLIAAEIKDVVVILFGNVV